MRNKSPTKKINIPKTQRQIDYIVSDWQRRVDSELLGRVLQVKERLAGAEYQHRLDSARASYESLLELYKAAQKSGGYSNRAILTEIERLPGLISQQKVVVDRSRERRSLYGLPV